MGYPTRSKVVENYKLAEKLKAGELVTGHKQLMVVNNYQSNKDIIEASNRVENAINNMHKKMPKHNTYYDPIRMALVETIEQNNKKEIRTITIGEGGILGS